MIDSLFILLILPLAILLIVALRLTKRPTPAPEARQIVSVTRPLALADDPVFAVPVDDGVDLPSSMLPFLRGLE
jgi:hypothetical protein